MKLAEAEMHCLARRTEDNANSLMSYSRPLASSVRRRADEARDVAGMLAIARAPEVTSDKPPDCQLRSGALAVPE